MNSHQQAAIDNLNAALQQCLQAFPGTTGHQLIHDTVKRESSNLQTQAVNTPQPSFPTPTCIQTEEESRHFDQLRNFIDNLVLTVSPTGLTGPNSTHSSSGFEPTKRKSLDEPTNGRSSRRKLSEAEQEAARGLQELSAGV
ncbi:hypothetical protein CJF32_00001853 [Rutstroemia sp. NJR-2017a WRK4]|nr:hypothetical protein CJF32_00001853 [Rutstroemia sp. NJR-2017a WRK4]